MQLQYKERFLWMSLLSNPKTPGEQFRVVRLNNWLLEEILLETNGLGITGPHPLYYLCGPPAFMCMVVFTLRVVGLCEEKIKRENFTVEYVPPPPLLSDTSPKKSSYPNRRDPAGVPCGLAVDHSAGGLASGSFRSQALHRVHQCRLDTLITYG